VLAECGTSIKDIYHNRSTPDTDISSVRVTCVVETADRDNAQRMHDTLVEHGCVLVRGPACQDVCNSTPPSPPHTPM